MKKKTLVVVILGAKHIRPGLHLLGKIIIFLYNKFGISHLSHFRYENQWKKNFYSQDRHVICLHWGRGITKVSRYFALRKLSRIISIYKKTHNITLVGYSMGGGIALEACKRFDGVIKKAILVFSANETSQLNLKKTKIINIYSPLDFFVQTAIKLLAPFTGNQKLIGQNITNIALNNFEHSEVFSNKKISDGKFSGKTIPELINELI